MTVPEIADVVGELNPRFLQGLTTAERNEVLACAKVRKYLANTTITHEGHPADHLFLLLHGRARYFTLTPQGDKALLFWVAAGECVGGAAIISVRCNYILSSETAKSSRVLAWDRSSINALSRKYPRLLENALIVAHDYFVLYRAAHLSLACQSARQRLATVLVNLASGIGERVPEGVQLDVSNEELANEAHVTHFTASRLMSQWQRSGVLIKRRGKVLLPAPELLFSQQI